MDEPWRKGFNFLAILVVRLLWKHRNMYVWESRSKYLVCVHEVLEKCSPVMMFALLFGRSFYLEFPYPINMFVWVAFPLGHGYVHLTIWAGVCLCVQFPSLLSFVLVFHSFLIKQRSAANPRGKNEEQKLLLQGTHVPRTQKSIIIPFLHKDIIASHLVKEVWRHDTKDRTRGCNASSSFP